jgi:hypothetical protein
MSAAVTVAAVPLLPLRLLAYSAMWLLFSGKIGPAR